MTRVDFYILNTASPQQQQLFACKLAAKAASQGHTIFIYHQDSKTLQSLDELLWSYQAESFLPHEPLYGNQNFNDKPYYSPIMLGQDLPQGYQADVLINLDKTLPAFFSQFHRMGKIVINQDDALNDSRENYRNLQHKGYPLHIHDLRNTHRQ